jgi:DNA-binding transcriptional ArsR family regulator
MLTEDRPLGVREIQRALSAASPSGVFHHLDRLKGVGLVSQDEHGRYQLLKRIDVGVLEAFSRVGGIWLPRFAFYSVFFSTVLVVYLILFGVEANIYALSFGVAGIIFSWYETLRTWRKRPF